MADLLPVYRGSAGNKIPKSSSMTITNVGGVKTATEIYAFLDIDEWSEAEVRDYAAQIAAEQIAEQTSIDNPATEVLVDGAVTLPVSKMKRDIVVYFGDSNPDARPAMRDLELQVVRSGLNLGGYANWKWIFPANRPELQQAYTSGAPVRLTVNDTLYYVPRGREGLLNLFNYYVRDRRSYFSFANPFKSLNGEETPARGTGALARTSMAVNKIHGPTGFRVGAGYSNQRRDQIAGQDISPGINAKVGRSGRRNTISRRTGKPAYYQGIPMFRLRRRLGPSVRQRPRRS